jgi:DNA-binding transcriptional regulator YiaG
MTEKAIVLNLYKEGIRLNEISQKLNVSLNSVLEILEVAIENFQYKGPITFNQSHIKEILVLYEDTKISSKEIGKKFGHCKKTVLKILRKNRMILRPSGTQKIMTEDEPEIIKMKLAGFKSREIAEKFGVSIHPILRVLHKNNIKVDNYIPSIEDRQSMRKYHCNKRYFSSIDSDDKAYFLGLFAADGGFKKNTQGEITGILIGLKKSSAPILQKFLEYIESDDCLRKASYLYEYKGKIKRLDSRIAIIFSVEVAEDVRRQLQLPEGTFNKTYDVIYPHKTMPKSFEASFCRGVFDGDGTINYYPNSSKQEKDMFISFYGTKKLLEGIRDIICKNCSVSFAKIKPKITNGEFSKNRNKKNKVNENMIDEDNLYELSWSGRRQILAILDWMYKDAELFLEEKYYKYKTINRKKAVIDLAEVISVEEIIEKRRKMGISQLALARSIFCSSAVISDYERNVRTTMTHENAKRFLDFFNVNYDKGIFFY